MRPHQSLCIIALFFAASAACDNQPAQGKPHAAVQEVKEIEQAKQAEPAAAAQAPGQAQPPQPSAAGRNSFAFSQDNSKVEFTGAKVTGKDSGSFKRFSGMIQLTDTAAGPTAGSVHVEIEIASLETDIARLTGHLKSPDLLDAAKFPKARFHSTKITAEKDAAYTVTGNFELHGVTKQISFPATIRVHDEQIEADAEFAINRKDFDITYPGKPDDLIKDDVLIKLTIRSHQLR